MTHKSQKSSSFLRWLPGRRDLGARLSRSAGPVPRELHTVLAKVARHREISALNLCYECPSERHHEICHCHAVRQSGGEFVVNLFQSWIELKVFMYFKRSFSEKGLLK